MKVFLQGNDNGFIKLTRSKITMVLLVLFLLFTLILSFFVWQHTQSTSQSAAAGIFRIRGNKIYDPNGVPFIVKGVTAINGRFNDVPNPSGLLNYQNAQRDLESLKRLGVNVVRIPISAYYANLAPNEPSNLSDYMQELDNVVNWTVQRGMVAYLVNSESPQFQLSLKFVSQLASRYRSNPYVWLGPQVEPNCNTSNGDPTKCLDWGYWQAQEIQYAQAIRKAGMTSPIVVNGINYSWDLSKIGSYPLYDSNIIYGAHRFANYNVGFTASQQADCDSKWANLAKQFPVIVDEVGAYNAGIKGALQLYWNQEFIDYVTNWVNTRGGSGAIGFVYYWINDNSMSGNWREHSSDGVLTPWGSIFFNSYLRKVVL